MSTLKEQAQIIRDETTPGANTAARIGNMFVGITDELGKKISTSAISDNTGSSTTTVMSQKGVTDELNKVDKVFFTSLDITTKSNGSSVSEEDKTELNKIVHECLTRPVYCIANGAWYNAVLPNDIESLWDTYIIAYVGDKIYKVYEVMAPENWSISIIDLSQAKSINVVQTTGSSTTDIMSQDAVTKELNKKQKTLVSGTNIRTINGQSILGSGNIEISGTGGGIADAPSVPNESFDRVNGKWNVNKYYIPGDLNKINLVEDTSSILGDYASFVQAAQGNATIIAKYTEGDDSKYRYLGTIINYVFCQDDGSFELSYIIGNKLISFKISVRNGSWGSFTDYNLQDLSKEYLENNAPYDDKIYGRKNNKWVEITDSTGGGFEDAPSDGFIYGRKDGTWTKTVGKIDPNSDGTGEIFNTYEGNSKNIATGDNSHAEGYNTHAEGNYSHAEGYNTFAKGEYSHAGGIYSHAEGHSSHAEGHSSYAIGDYSYARNPYTEAKGEYSHAEGPAVHTDNYAQFSIGIANIIDDLPSPNIFNMEKRGFVIGNGTWPGMGYGASSTGDAFRVFFNGKVESDLNYSTPAADYAEMFEWEDGNINNEDRVGLFVTLEGENIVLANSDSTYILGIISAVPAVLGDSPIQWQGKYLNDEWGRPIYEDIEYMEVKEVVKEDGTIEKIKGKKTAHVRKINPDYNQDETYEARADRPEWDAVGMLGKLLVKHDGTLVKGGFCRPSNKGIATKSDSGYYVMKVVNDHQALVLFR